MTRALLQQEQGETILVLIPGIVSRNCSWSASSLGCLEKQEEDSL